MPTQEDIMKVIDPQWDTYYASGMWNAKLYEALEALGATRLGYNYLYRNVPKVNQGVGDEVILDTPIATTFVKEADGEATFCITVSSNSSAPSSHNNSGCWFNIFTSIGDPGSDADVIFPNGRQITTGVTPPVPGFVFEDYDDEVAPEAFTLLDIENLSSDFANIAGFNNRRVMSSDYFTQIASLNMGANLDQEFKFKVTESFDLVIRGRSNVDGFQLIRDTDGVVVPMALTNLEQQRVGLYPDVYTLKSLGDNTLTEFRAEPLSGGYNISEPILPVSVAIVGPDSLNEGTSTAYDIVVTDGEGTEHSVASYDTFTSDNVEVTISGFNVDVSQGVVGDGNTVTLEVQFTSQGTTVNAQKVVTLVDTYVPSADWRVLENQNYRLSLDSPQMSDGVLTDYCQFYTTDYSIIEVDGYVLFQYYLSTDGRYNKQLMLEDLLNGTTVPMNLVSGWNTVALDRGLYKITTTGNTLLYEWKSIYYDKATAIEPLGGTFTPISLEATVDSPIVEYSSGTYEVEAVAADDARKFIPVTISVDSSDIVLADVTGKGATLDVTTGLTLSEDLNATVTATLQYNDIDLTLDTPVVITDIAYRPAVVTISDSDYTSDWGNPNDGRLSNGVNNVHSNTECIQIADGEYFFVHTDDYALFEITALTEVSDLTIMRMADNDSQTVTLVDGVTQQIALPKGGYRIYGTGLTTISEFKDVTYNGESALFPENPSPVLNDVSAHDNNGNNYYTLSAQVPVFYDEIVQDGWSYMEFDMNTNSYTPEACGPAITSDGAVNYWHYGRGTYPFNAGQRIGLLIKLPEGHVWASKNGVWENNGDPELYSREGKGGNPITTVNVADKDVKFGSNCGTGSASQYTIFNDAVGYEQIHKPNLG